MPTQLPLTPSSDDYSVHSDKAVADPVTAIAKELERLSLNFAYALNAHDYDFDQTEEARETRSHVSEDWMALFDTVNNSQPVTFDQQVQAWKQRAKDSPHVRFQPVDISSDVDLPKGRASVFCEMEVTGIGNIALQAMNEMKWRRDSDGRWECYFVIGFRGSRMNSGYG